MNYWKYFIFILRYLLVSYECLMIRCKKSTRSSCCNENCDNFSEDFSMFVAMLEIRSPSSPELVDIELEKIDNLLKM